MKAKLLVTLLSAALPSLVLADTLEIDRLGTNKQHAYIDDGWRNASDCIEVRFKVAEEMEGKRVGLKAYFFDAAGEIVHQLKSPTPVSNANLGTSAIPPILEGGKKYTVFFGIPERFKTGAKKWRRVVVVLIDGKETVAKVYPTDDISKFEFPEKSKLK